MLASHSALTLPPRCRLGSLEEELEWSTGHSFNHSSTQYVFEHQGCRDKHYMDHIFEELKKLSRETTWYSCMVSATAKVLAATPWSAGEKTTEPWKSVTPLERVWQKSIGHFQAMYNAVYLAMLNKVIVDNSLAILWNVWRGRILMVEMKFGDYLRLLFFFISWSTQAVSTYIWLCVPPLPPPLLNSTWGNRRLDQWNRLRTAFQCCFF